MMKEVPGGLRADCEIHLSINLRNMEVADLPEVNLLLSKAFTDAQLQKGDRTHRVPLCRQEFLEYYLAASDGGALILEENSKIIAYCFLRNWGSVGWLGPLSVLPAFQGNGHGSRIVKEAICVLRGRAVRTIGLEMAADSVRNLGFYTRIGFVPECMTVDLVRPVSPGMNPGGFDEVLKYSSILGNRDVHQKLRSFFEQFEVGLDYLPEAAMAIKRGFGDAIILRDGERILAFALVHTESYSTEEQRQFLKVNILQILENKPINTLDTILYHLDRWAVDEKLNMLYIRLPFLRRDTIRCFLSRGFSIVQNDLRLVFQDTETKASGGWLNLSKWE